jgi:hypothetical protein
MLTVKDVRDDIRYLLAKGYCTTEVGQILYAAYGISHKKIDDLLSAMETTDSLLTKEELEEVVVEEFICKSSHNLPYVDGKEKKQTCGIPSYTSSRIPHGFHFNTIGGLGWLKVIGRGLMIALCIFLFRNCVAN